MGIFVMADVMAPADGPVWNNSKMKFRRNFLLGHYDASKADILELGAFASPTFLKAEHNVFYADRMSTDDLRSNVADPAKRAAIVDVDTVVASTVNASSFDRKFDLVVANHVIEHTPNLIGWLLGIASTLRSGGALFLAVPDRDYTFDKLRELTTLRELMLLHQIAGDRPPLSHVVDHRWGYRPINVGGEVWNDTHGPKLDQKTFPTYGAALRAVSRLYDSVDYLDCHCNVFTAARFKTIMSHLQTVEWFPFTLQVVAEPQRPYNEFLTVLKLKPAWHAALAPQAQTRTA